jgi:hypothetical protein
MATQEQDDFAEAFGEDVQRSEMSEDEAFGLAPEPDLETPDEEDADVAEEAEEPAAEPAIAESAPNDPAPAETGEAGPAEETAVVVEPGAEDAGDVEVMSPEDIQREKSWMGRLKAKEAELKAREEALKGAAPAEESAEASAEAPAAEAMEDAMEKVESGELTFEQAMQTLEADFGPDFPKMLTLVAKHIGAQVSDERVGSVRGELDEVVNELRTEKEKSHYETISEAHPDFMEVGASPEFRAYVEGLPASEQEAAMQVINGGTAKQINKLLSDYKAKGQVTTEADLEKPPAAAPVDESALDAAEGVRSAGLKIPEKPAQADDYEAAWEQF